MLPSVLRIFRSRRVWTPLSCALACFLGGCGEPAEPTDAGAPIEAAAARSEPEVRNERPLPAFSGRDLEGRTVSISEFVGKRLLLFFFNPEVDAAEPVAKALSALAPSRVQHNFEIVGVAMGSSVEKARAFRQAAALDIRVFDDSSAAIAGQFGLRVPVGVLGVDSEGYLAFAIGNFPSDGDDPVEAIESDLRRRMRLPAESGHASGALDPRPLAPLFEAQRLDGGEPFRLTDASGRPVVLVFFLHTCPHCHEALVFFREQLAALPEAARPLLIGVSVQNRPTAVRALLAEHDLDFFPVLLDAERSVQSAYGVFAGVPDIVMIDSERRVVHRIQGWSPDRDPALARMFLYRIAGQPVPMLLNPKGYTGNDVCGVCHEKEYDTWLFTQHARAFDTLVTHGADRRSDCVGCHVVGFEEAGGYDLAKRPEHLENVGCETCHGRGGPHLSPGLVQNGDYQARCETCHNPTHSLGFEYSDFRPRISHQAIGALSDAARAKMLAGQHAVRDLLPKDARFVGSEACRSCHESEFETWASSAHARAVKSLADQGKSRSADCLACHTTAFGRPGGFPKQGVPSAHPDLARVGCESCHGPGGNHVGENAARVGTIVSLGDKCDSCVILQICGSCHDDANDPGFRFEVEARIEAQRHGTIEPGTGRPKGASAARSESPSRRLEAEVFEALARARAAGRG